MFIYSLFIEALILKAPDVEALFICKTYWKARFIKQRTFSSTEIEKLQVYRKKAWQKNLGQRNRENVKKWNILAR